MKSVKPNRKGAFTPIPKVIRMMSGQSHCEVCKKTYKELDEDLLFIRQNLDHIFPRRFLSHWHLNPHDRLNIISLCGRCHGKKKKAEDCLWRGDVIGYLKALQHSGWPMSYIWRAAVQYEFKEVLCWFRSEAELK